ncbi:MAG: hypothetical protein JST68_10465, partial [Bacteroidetes bacterium]|nr:hypothetical protein [Bacteroidota bacterium]
MKILLLAILITTTITTTAQTLGQRAKATTTQKVGDRMDQSISGGVDSTVNKAGRAIGGLFKKKPKKTADPAQPDPNATTQPAAAPQPASIAQPAVASQPAVITAYGDFTPGATPLFDDDFAQDALQDFPAKWNTNGSGKLVSIDGLPGKWLDIAHNSVANPVLNKVLPENCTISFDLFLQSQGDMMTPSIQFGLTPVSDILKEDIFYKDRFYVGINRYHENDGHTLEYGLKDPIGNKNDFPLPSYTNKILHIDMAINKTRIRVYADRNKLIDLPRALTPAMHNNFY